MFELRNPNGFRDADAARLGVAGLLSLLLHAAALSGGSLIHWRPSPQRPAGEPLRATLVSMSLPPPPVLLAPVSPPPAADAKPEVERQARPKPSASPSRRGFTATDLARLALQQIARQPFYPEAAIAQGLEGEAVVRLFLDESGDAVAARLESSSGHALLDDAAVHAARAVRSLPVGSASEVSLPVRFRLR